MIDSADRRRLEAVHSLFKMIEAQSAQEPLPAEGLRELKGLLAEFSNHPQIEIQKLSQIIPHLHDGISLRTFVNFLVPVERALNKNVRDDDILPVISDVDRISHVRQTIPLRLVLDQIRSAFNVGSVLRTADGLGIEKVHLTGYTPTPLEDKTARTALGSEASVDWDHTADVTSLFPLLKSQGLRLIAFETSEDAIDLQEPFIPEPTAFVFGNERFGLSPDLLALCDEVRILPMHGQKNSLNVGVMAAIAAYEWRRQWTRQ